jgi:hypothetical protein
MGAYAPATGKTHFEIFQKLIKSFALTSQHSMCARQVSQKKTFFVACVKKIKKMSRKSYF